ncbi:protein FAR-RED IMPAIRED RESPONSE 1-like [Aegilops tauschii subsp. strangulata]|uniref:protein FAR-RED IMPAIRED RESPONSE 1-like n=1 Tax=Aegilops tauschii subsp. strangulata TaxID=200361 RepID=UPI001ABCA19C|nr:protein FAR-RED IMPAIRED RESPONSE 1-like [Aegilops tauschii subsp. strangulata]
MPVRRPREEEEEVRSKNMPLEIHQYYMCAASVSHVPMMQKQIKHAKRHTQRGFDEPSRYGAPPGWPPNIEAYVLPRLEMRFETFKEVKDFYNVYAKHAGFAVREGSKVETRVYLYYTCYGVYESKVSEANRQRNKTAVGTNCGAKMKLKREKDGTLVFKGIEHAQIMSILGGDDPSSYFLEMNAKDMINIKAKNSRMDDVDDVLKTVNFFREMKAINREFFCDMQLDESDRVKNIFWANASCRGAYQDIGDCVAFDTTYKTNKYHMPLGVFVGTNNHLQTTFFGFALIRDEDADSFRWLFKTFLRCMRGKAPTCILID